MTAAMNVFATATATATATAILFAATTTSMSHFVVYIITKQKKINSFA
jgi:hypothetical protein